MAIVLCEGVTCDYALQFGQASAVQLAMRRLDNILELVAEQLYRRCVVWSVWTPTGRRQHSRPARCWDNHPVVFEWRVQRYNAGKRAGLDEEACILGSFPFDKQGYIDDSLCPTIDLFMDLFFEELFAYCLPKGILLSIPKCAKADAFGRKWLMKADKTWAAPIRGCLTPLGKYLEMNLWEGIVKERPDRIFHLIARTQAFLATAQKRINHFVCFDDMESLIGQWRYTAQTCLALGPLLQFPTRNLHARFSNRISRLRTLGAVLPLLERSKRAFELMCIVGKENRGVAFAPDRSAVNWDTAIWVIHDAAGYSEEEPDSYRGHFSIIIVPGADQVYYVQGQWSAEELLNDSTTLESCGGNVGIGPAILVPAKPCQNTPRVTLSRRMTPKAQWVPSSA